MSEKQTEIDAVGRLLDSLLSEIDLTMAESEPLWLFANDIKKQLRELNRAKSSTTERHVESAERMSGHCELCGRSGGLAFSSDTGHWVCAGRCRDDQEEDPPPGTLAYEAKWHPHG